MTDLLRHVRHALWLTLIVLAFAVGWLLYIFVFGPIFGYRIGEDAL